MSHGSSGTINSPKSRALNGRAHCHQDPKRQGCSSPKPRWCWSLFFMSMELSTQNFCHKAKLLISTVTKTSCKVWCEGEKKRTTSWLLHLDNTPAHNLLGIWEFLAKNNIAVPEQPSYSPDLAPCDFFLFPKHKEVIKGTRFQKPLKQSWRESSEGSRRNPRRLLWRRHVVKFTCQIK